jgi:hypothetical protein
MSAYRIKLYGLTDIDKSSLASMLKLAHDLLSHEWKIVDQGTAELCIYSFDTSEGITAWQQREEGLTALLAVQGNITEPVDIILKKPLRTTNFSEALNLIEDKIVASSKKNETPKSKIEKSAKSNSVFSTFSNNISKFLSTKKSNHTSQSFLLQTPELTADASQTLIETELLLEWIVSLKHKNKSNIIEALLGNLIPLNRLDIQPKTRFALLEIYRTIIHDLFFTRDAAAVHQDLKLDGSQNLLRAMSLLIDELTIGYKHVVNQLHSKEQTSSNSLFLKAIHHTTEQLAIQILNAYLHYYSAPTGSLHELHQIYLYCEQHHALHNTTETKTGTQTFYQLYTQIIVISIADPYSLDKFDVLRLFKLMSKFAHQVEIEVLSEKQIKTTSDFLMTGHFCLDGTSDHPPSDMAKTPIEIRKQADTRLFNTQPVLLAIEKIFKLSSQSAALGTFDLDIQLLKKIIPQLNTSYERKYQRLPGVKSRQLHIANGIDNIHACLDDENANRALDWVITNQGSGGIMATRNNDDCHHYLIGDYMGLFEPNLPAKITVIRWLNVDNNGFTHVGLELQSGHPKPVYCLTDDNLKEYKALLFPENKEQRQSATLLAEKGLFSPNRQLKIKGDGEPYRISASKLVNSTFNFEQISFTIITKN